MAKNNQRDPNLRAATVARVNQLVKGGLTKAGAFEKISAETGRAKDAVQMLYYRAIRAAKTGPKNAPKNAAKNAPKNAPTTSSKSKSRARRAPAKTTAPVVAARPAAAAPKPAPRRRRRSRKASKRVTQGAQGIAQSGDFPTLLSGIASAINALLKHVEKTVEENKTLKQQSQRLQAIANLIRGR